MGDAKFEPNVMTLAVQSALTEQALVRYIINKIVAAKQDLGASYPPHAPPAIAMQGKRMNANVVNS